MEGGAASGLVIGDGMTSAALGSCHWCLGAVPWCFADESRLGKLLAHKFGVTKVPVLE